MMLTDKNLLVTGVSGFVGSALARAALGAGGRVRGVGRGEKPQWLQDYQALELTSDTGWGEVLNGIDCVIHCAAMPGLAGTDSEAIARLREINVNATVRLAEQASQRGVKRFIFVSSVKVNGELTRMGSPFQESDPPRPQDPYGQSKLDAEVALLSLAGHSAMEIVIVRPVLVYGPGVKGNFLSILKLARTGVPLPLASIRNERSMVFIGNLVDLLLTCIDHPNAANQVFLAADREALATADLVRSVRRNLNIPERLFKLPVPFLRLFGKIAGAGGVVSRLCDSLQVDMAKARATLGWEPPFSNAEGLKLTVQWYRDLG